MSDRWLTLGRVVGVFGVKGWVKVESFTDPRDNLLKYREWQLASTASGPVKLEQGRMQGQTVLAKLIGIDDRDRAQGLIGAEIQVQRSQLPQAAPGEYYWVDLEGLEAFTVEGVRLGVVSHLFATGANDVLVIQGDREHLVPCVMEHFVKQVDLAGNKIILDWDPTF